MTEMHSLPGEFSIGCQTSAQNEAVPDGDVLYILHEHGECVMQIVSVPDFSKSDGLLIIFGERLRLDYLMYRRLGTNL